MTSPNVKQASERELVITRRFDAPIEIVWRAWTDAEHAKQWAPQGFVMSEWEMDLRVGGAWHAVMVSPEGKSLRQHGAMTEYEPMRVLAYTFIWDENPREAMHVRVQFAAAGKQTEMLFRQTGFASDDSRDGHRGGWAEAFGDLDRVLSGTRDPRPRDGGAVGRTTSPSEP